MTNFKLPINKLAPLIAKREISVTELVKSFLARIEAVDAKVGAYLFINGDKALKEAQSLDAEIAKNGVSNPLMGIPIAPKDNYLTKGIQTTCASKILNGYVPPYNGTVIRKLLEKNVIILGKVNLDEFAMGSSTENSAFIKTKNPWDLERVPGGSSGGSAAVVAASMACASLGSDTGGSIRQPASLCGVVGLKPTYGRVSRYGVIAFASSLDQMGPVTKDVTDSALMMNVISGFDSHDSTSVNKPVPDYTQFLNKPVKGLRIGLPKEYFIDGIDASVKKSIESAVKEWEKQGAIVEEISLPHTDYATAAYYIVASAEASSNLARFDGVRYGLRAKSSSLHELYEKTKTEGFGSEVKRRIMLGTYVLSSGYYDAYYKQAQKVRTLIIRDFEEAYKKVDLIVTPTSPTTAFKFGEKTENPVQMYLSDICTIPVNLAGLPALSIPCGFDDKNLPIGVQLIGKPFDEGTLFKAAHAYEQVSIWHQKNPGL